jgi:hypothetical protein
MAVPQFALPQRSITIADARPNNSVVLDGIPVACVVLCVSTRVARYLTRVRPGRFTEHS